MTVQPTNRVITAPAAQAVALPQAARVVAPKTGQPGPYVQFEAFVLQSFIQAIMPKDATEVFGEGTAGEVWKSMLAEKMALQFAEAGGVGIAKMLAAHEGNGAAQAGLPGQASAASRLVDMQLAASSATSAGIGTASKRP